MNTQLAKIGILLAAITLVGASCGVAPDGGVYRSSDEAENFEQAVYVSTQNRQTVTIGDLDVEKLVADPLDPETIYLAAKSEGLWRTTNGGGQWNQLPLTPDRIRDVAIDPQNTDIIYTVKGPNIIKSVDKGQGWEIVYTDTRGAIITRLAVDWFNTNRVFAVTSTGSIILTEDAGTSWRTVFETREPFVGIYMSSEDSRVLYALELETNVYKTTDGGATWNPVITEEIEDQFRHIDDVLQFAIDPNDPNILFMSSEEGIVRSRDAGVTWEYMPTLIERYAEENINIRSITVQPNDSNMIFFTVGNLIHKSFDGGRTWRTLENFPSGRTITTLAIQENFPERIFAGVEEPPNERRGFFGAR